MKQPTSKDIFDFIETQVSALAVKLGEPKHKAFPRWFTNMYYTEPEGALASDGAGDAKVDFFFHTVSGSSVKYHVINSKFTNSFNQASPVTFYDEVLAFYQLFREPLGRAGFLNTKVRPELHVHYKKLFKEFDDGNAHLIFLTNHRANTGQLHRVKHLEGLETFHLEDLTQHVLDDFDGAMPRTPPLTLQQIGSTLSPPKGETGVATMLVFARLVDFVDYMERDPYDLLFARNVRVSQGNTHVNRAITDTFVDHPEQFAYSSNGITLLCESATHDTAAQALTLENPRVVNGSQTLHSVRQVQAPPGAKKARVMVRIITIPRDGTDSAQGFETKEIVNRISIRSNQQNPIKAWNLRANDDFQMDLARRFRQEDVFYERRDKEWSSRASQLKSVGISRGPTIKALMAQIACFHWKNTRLGPALAKGNLGDLFHGEGYDVIRESTTTELAYQTHLAFQRLAFALSGLTQRRYRNARRHIDLAVFSITCRALTEAKAEWRKSALTELLTRQREDYSHFKAWDDLARMGADLVLKTFDKAARKSEDSELSIRNFVRRREEIHQMISSPLKKQHTAAAHRVLST